MPKKTKKQRQALGFKTIDLSLKEKDISNNNSSSIIAVDDQHQSSLQQLTVSPTKPQPNMICIKPRKTLNFQEEQQEQNNESKNQNQQTQSYGIIPSISQVKQQEETQQIQENQKKQTVTTNNQQRVSQIKINRHFTQQNQSKIQTQHYQYNQSQQESQEQQQQDEPQQQMNKKTINVKKITKSFIAESFEDLIFGQIPQGCTITCAVNFNHKILSTTRQYKLYLVTQKKFLFSAIKNRINLTSQFIFSRDTRSSNNQSHAIGYLKSNFTGVQYVVNKVHSKENNRISEQCWIGYDFNMLGLAHQRNITVLKNKNAKLEKIPFFSQIKNYYDNGITQKFQKFITKQATKNKKGEFQLDFHGKVTDPSVKNFILTDQKEKQCIIFGKRTNNTFILQIGYPFSIFQGFAIAVSNLDRKLCVR